MGVATIALLGPVAVHGDVGALAPRDRVVLSALAIAPNEVSSSERLADALWGVEPPPSWPKVVPGCIHRLRRAIGAEFIETTPHGYRLTLPGDEIDIRRFEHLLRRGRELLAQAEPDDAARLLAEALALWRGLPIPDLHEWEPGRVEAERLNELRLDAQECQVDAEIRAGRHADVLARAKTLVAEAPLRERRWWLLALAQYRAGRQSEALHTLRHARAMLVADLGLDPGPELAELEAAILRQDPSLLPGDHGPASTRCPYLGLVGYDIHDAQTFFGREWEAADCVRRLLDVGVLAVVGPSGSGKSSLVRAGVGAALGRDGHRPVVVTPGAHPMTAIADVDTVGVVLIVDQFEEVFTNCADPVEQSRFCDELVDRALMCRLVIAMRADRTGDLAAHPGLARLVERAMYLLGPMDSDALRAAITRPADQARLLLEPGLVDLLLQEVEGEPGALPLLSHALRQTWERRTGRTLTVDGYRATGGIRGCVAQTAEDLYESFDEGQRELLRRLLLRLISTTLDGEPVRTRVDRLSLITDPARAAMIDRLADARLVTTDRDTVQIAHECLARAWPRLAGWLDEDTEGQRIQRHLSATADAWSNLGRPDSDLYRGVRLAQAVDWRDSLRPTLTTVEADFLDAGVAALESERRAVAAQARQRVRSRRRGRLVIAVVATLLVAAAAAAGLAVRQQRQRQAAEVAARVTDAARVDDAARGAPEMDQALLLAIEANRIDDSPDTRSVLAGLLSAHPALIRSLPAREVVRALAVSPDGGTLLVGEGDTGTSVYRTDTLERTGTSELNGWSFRYRPDGTQILLTGRGSEGMDETSNALTTVVTGLDLSSPRHLQVSGIDGYWLYGDDIAYSGDAHRVAVFADGSSIYGDLVAEAFVVWDVDELDRPRAVIPTDGAIAATLGADGSVLYALTTQPSVEAIEVATGRVIASAPVPPWVVAAPDPSDPAVDLFAQLADTLEISPDGSTLAVGEGNDIVLLDAATLAERGRLRAQNRVLTLRFSHDGRRLAAGYADHTAAVWNLATVSRTEELTGHDADVLAVAFSADDGTLYTGGEDRRVLVWDLTGRRRLVGTVVDPSLSTPQPSLAAASPDGRSVVFTGSTQGTGSVRFLEVAAGSMGPELADPGGGPLVAWLPDSRAVVTAAGRTLRVRDRDSQQVTAERDVGPAAVTALTATPDGTAVVAGDRTGRLWQADAGSLDSVGAPISLGHPVTAVAAGPDGHAAALLDDGSYAWVDLTAGTVQHTGDLGIKGTVAALSPGGTALVVGGSRGEVGLLDLTDQQWLRPPAAAHRLYVVGAGFDAGGRFFTSAFDGSLRLWTGTGEPVGGLQIAGSPAFAAPAPDGAGVLVTTTDGAVRTVDADFASWIRFGCTVAGRDLTTTEWQGVFGDREYHRSCGVS